VFGDRERRALEWSSQYSGLLARAICGFKNLSGTRALFLLVECFRLPCAGDFVGMLCVGLWYGLFNMVFG
jgi:hypothetical protein